MESTFGKYKKAFLFLLIAGFSLAAFVWVVIHIAGIQIPVGLVVLFRYIGSIGLIGFAILQGSLTTWIMVSMILGAQMGCDYPELAVQMRVFSMIFLRMIKTIIAPLLFSTLVVGIAGHSDLKQIGRMGIKALIYFEIVTTVALFIGLGAINLTQAGVGIKLPPPPAGEQIQVKKQNIQDIILHIFPENLGKSVVEGEVLQIVVFSVLFGIGLATLTPARKRPMLEFAESLAETMFSFTKIIMYFAPVGVGAAIAYTVGHMGLGILVNLFKLLATLYVALAFFLLFVLLPIAYFVGVPIRKFLFAIAEPVSLAFATTSSEAALPRAMESLEGLGVPRHIVAFVMPTGYSFNLDGTTLYLSLASIFVAQAAGIHMPFYQQLIMVFTLMLTSKGVAGVPRASLVILLGTAASFNLPTEPIFIILGIDELMDMARTAVNVIGNCLATVVIGIWEKEFPRHKHGLPLAPHE